MLRVMLKYSKPFGWRFRARVLLLWVRYRLTLKAGLSDKIVELMQVEFEVRKSAGTAFLNALKERLQKKN